MKYLGRVRLRDTAPQFRRPLNRLGEPNRGNKYEPAFPFRRGWFAKRWCRSTFGPDDESLNLKTRDEPAPAPGKRILVSHFRL